jgi:hypothetical protein
VKTGDLIFIRGGNPVSFLVRLFDRGKWSHCAIAVSDRHILEIDWFTTCRIVEMKYEDFEVVELGLSNEQLSKLPQLAINTVGINYDFKYIVGHLLKTNLNNPRDMVCSEVLTYILGNLGWLNAEEMATISDATPNELYAFIKNKLNKI